MFFEGSEKKLEVVVDASAGSLLRHDEDFWSEVIKASQARILSSISTEQCRAFLLSESSLFVWEDRFTMITCGQTTLVHALKHFLENFELNGVKSIIYQRKNEYFPTLQKTDVHEDFNELKMLLGGDALRFGYADEHHVYVFQYENGFQAPQTDSTLELLMYDLNGVAAEVFRTPDLDTRKVRELTGITNLFSEFKIDDHIFDPYGYSLNALKDEEYYTIHVTPQELGSYVSFETNSRRPQSEVIEHVLNVFNPNSFDIVRFDVGAFNHATVDGYKQRVSFEDNLKSGYKVSFNHYFKESTKRRSAFPMWPFKRGVSLVAKYIEYNGRKWVVEVHENQFFMGYAFKEQLFEKQSPYQHVSVVDTESHGKMLFNDHLVMVSERDEFVYHEMISHIPFFVHPNVKKVLVIGGGDGGTAREILRHDSVEECVMVEIDPEVINSCKEFIPLTASVMSDEPRLELRVEDAVKYVAETDKKFDLILVDSTDPIGPAQPLFGEEFYQNINSILKDDGIVISQGESCWYESEMQKKLLSILDKQFSISTVYNFSNLTYPGGLWSFTFASKKYHPLNDFNESRVETCGLEFKYYNKAIHKAAFALPQFMHENLKGLIKV